MSGIKMVTNQFFTDFLPLAFASTLANKATYDLGEISHKTVIGNISGIKTTCSGQTR
jgi:hypothetical protein